jgi:hypothetical protein
MTDIFLMDNLADYLTIDTPEDFIGTVDFVQGHVVGLKTTGSWDNNAWRGGAIEMTSGDAIHLRNVVMESHANQLILAVPFPPNKVPKENDTFRLTGGPLSQAVIYLEEPTTLADDWEEGKRFFVIVDAVTGDGVISGMGGRTHSGVEATRRGFGFEVMCITKRITGKATESEVYRVMYDLPLLKEQVLSLAIAWRLNAANGIKGDGEIAWGKITFQLAGTDPMKGYVLEFNVAMGRGN